MGGAFPKIFLLNPSATKLHNVRAEPIKEAKVVGHLLVDRQVSVQHAWRKCLVRVCDYYFLA